MLSTQSSQGRPSNRVARTCHQDNRWAAARCSSGRSITRVKMLRVTEGLKSSWKDLIKISNSSNKNWSKEVVICPGWGGSIMAEIGSIVAWSTEVIKSHRVQVKLTHLRNRLSICLWKPSISLRCKVSVKLRSPLKVLMRPQDCKMEESVEEALSLHSLFPSLVEKLQMIAVSLDVDLAWEGLLSQKSMRKTSAKLAIRKRKSSRRKVTKFTANIRAWQTIGCSKTWDLVRIIYLHTWLMDIHLCCNNNLRIKPNNQVDLVSPRAKLINRSCRRWKEGGHRADLIMFSGALTSICLRITTQEKEW